MHIRGEYIKSRVSSLLKANHGRPIIYQHPEVLEEEEINQPVSPVSFL